MKFLFAALLAAFIIILSGCVSVSPPENCLSLSADDQPGCVYYSAVMNQDPYACYALQNESQRTVCLKDAIDPSAKKAIAKKKTVVSSGTLANSSTGLKTPTAAPAAVPANATAEANNTVPVKPLGGLRTLNATSP